MGKPYPLDLRELICAYVAEGNSARSAKRLFGVSAATAVRSVAEHREHGSAVSKPQGRPAGQFGKLAPHWGFLLEIVQVEPDITLKELAAALSETHGVADRHLKKGLIAAERERPALRHLRHDWIERRQPACARSRTGWSLSTRRRSRPTSCGCAEGPLSAGGAMAQHLFGKWGTLTFIAGLTQVALIAPWVIKGTMNGPAIDTYIKARLAPALDPGTVVILETLSTHKSPRAAQALRESGCWFLFLPAYSRDLNPIEMAFSKLKAQLRRIGARTFDTLFHALGDICDLFDPQE